MYKARYDFHCVHAIRESVKSSSHNKRVFLYDTDRRMIDQEIVGLTVHLPFVGKDDFASTAWRIYGKSFLEALFDIRRPHALRVRCRQVLLVLQNTII